MNFLKSILNKISKLPPAHLAILFLYMSVVIMSFSLGALWTKVQYLEGGVAPSKKADEKANVLQPSQAGVEDVAAKIDVPEPSDKDHIRGNKNADLALIEYSDFSCPYCKTFHVTALKVIEEYGDRMMWVYRHFPLASIHPLAQKQSEASECAAKLGGETKFWQVTDAIYSADGTVDDAALASIAAKAGLNATAFKNCLEKGDTKSIVDAQYEAGIEAGVRGTPGNFLMNVKTGETVQLQGAVPFENIKTSIESMLK